MIDLSKIHYRVTAILQDKRQIDITDAVNALGWSEAEKELSAKITLKLAAQVEFDGKPLGNQIKPFTPIIIHAALDGETFEEVMRGNVTKISVVESNKDFYLQIEAADEVQALRKNEDEFFFSDGHGAKEILEEILGKWNVPHEIKIQDAKLSKKVYRKKKLCDMVADILKDLKERGGGVYFIRARQGVIEIIPRGTNETIYHFDVADNVVRTQESFDASSIVTRVKVVGKQRAEGKQKVEATVDGRTDLGVRQVIITRNDKETLEETQTAAKKILDEFGSVKHELSIEAPDLPTMRKGDLIRATSSTGTSYFHVKSIRHDAAQMKMNLELDEAKDKNKEFGLSFETDDTNENSTSEAR